MSEWRVPREGPTADRPWVAVAVGLLGGVLITGLIVFLVDPTGGDRRRPVAAAARAALEVDLFRLPSGAAHEALLLPAGPDAIGEPVLSQRLFPGESPPRRLASLVLANLSESDPWRVDLDALPLMGRSSPSGQWVAFPDLRAELRNGDATLTAADRLRLRSLGAGQVQVELEPGSLRRILLALPPERTLEDLAGVKWGETPLLKDRVPVERLREFRADPAAGVTR